MNLQTETNQDDNRGLVYNHDKARVLATSSTHSMSIRSAQLNSNDNSLLSPIASRQASTNLVNEPRPQLIKR